MALIECPECKKEISSLAKICPHCGMPIADSEGTKSKVTALVTGLCVVAALIVLSTWFYFTPYLAVHRMKAALLANDPVELSNYVNFPLLKESLKANISSWVASKIITQNGPYSLGDIGHLFQSEAIIEPMINAFMTPDNLNLILQGYAPKLTANNIPLPYGKTIAQRHEYTTTVRMTYDSFDRFVVSVWKRGHIGEPVCFIFNRNGLFSWKLSSLRLPLSDIAYVLDTGCFNTSNGPNVTILNSVKAYYLENVYFGEELILTGEVLNKSNKPVSSILLEGTLYNRNNTAVQTQLCYAGNSFTNNELTHLNLSEVHERMNNPEGRNILIAPSGKAHFALVFHDLTDIDNHGTYSVRVVSSKFDK